MEKVPEDNLKRKNEKDLKKLGKNLKGEKQIEEKDTNINNGNLNEENYLPNYIKRFGKEIGLPNLEMNENNVCSLCFRETINVDIVYNENGDQCILASPVCSIPKNDREKFYEQLLISNNAYNENGGLILGIEEKTNRVVLSYTFIPSTFSYFMFKIVLLNFVDITEKNMLKYEEF